MTDYISPKLAPEIPSHLCQCGCGAQAPFARRGKNKYSKFRPGHNSRNSIPEIALWRNARPGNPSDCWEWQGSVDKDGYGKTTLVYVFIRAHRLSYMIHYGVIPDGMDVCHSCDNPGCVNPNHLWLGTNQANMDDKCRKNRASRLIGITHPSAKLDDSAIREIRNMRLSGMSYVKIAKIYDITRSNARKICLGMTWQHVV